jgi:hypothetical protein
MQESAFFTEEQRKDFENKGVDQIRAQINSPSYPEWLKDPMRAWVATKDRQAYERLIKLQAEDRKIAKGANKAAWIAATGAIVAALLALTTLVAQITNWRVGAASITHAAISSSIGPEKASR